MCDGNKFIYEMSTNNKWLQWWKRKQKSLNEILREQTNCFAHTRWCCFSISLSLPFSFLVLFLTVIHVGCYLLFHTITTKARAWGLARACLQSYHSLKLEKLSQKWKNFNAVKRNHRIFLVIHCNKSCVCILSFFCHTEHPHRYLVCSFCIGKSVGFLFFLSKNIRKSWHQIPVAIVNSIRCTVCICSTDDERETKKVCMLKNI